MQQGRAPLKPAVLIAGLDALGGTGNVFPLTVDSANLNALVVEIAPTGSVLVSGAASVGTPVAANPLGTGLEDGNGNNQYAFSCTLEATLSTSSAGNQQIIAASGVLIPRICAIHFSTGSPENVSITTGTGVNCAVGTATLDSYIGVVAADPNYSALYALAAPAGNAVCVNPAAAQAIFFTVIYAQF